MLKKINIEIFVNSPIENNLSIDIIGTTFFDVQGIHFAYKYNFQANKHMVY